MHLPPFVGHGPPKVPDHLRLWLVPREAPSAEHADALAATLPADLQEWAATEHLHGFVGWVGGVLHVDSGMDVRYLVKALDPNHLAWVPAEVSEADIDRILDEVMDGERKGPKAPEPSEWALLGAMVGQWVESVHGRQPLWMVVVDRKVTPPGTARHQVSTAWVREHLDDVVARHRALHAATDGAYRATGWGASVVRALLSDKKKPKEAERQSLLSLLQGPGMTGITEGSKLLGMWPKSQRPRQLARMLEEGHELSLALLATPAHHGLLLDDTVFEAAMTPRPRMFPGDMHHQVSRRMQKPKLGDQQHAWLRRMMAVAEADGTLQRLADEEPPEQLSHKTMLRWWGELTAWFG